MTDRDKETLSTLHALAQPESITLLTQDLAHRAEREGLLDIAYKRIDTRIGQLLLAATPAGLVRVAFDCENHDAVLQTLADKLSARILEAESRLESAAEQINEYLAGQRYRFELDLDFSLSSGFRRMVQTRLSDIPFGHTNSYTQVATAVGNPKAVRAVGSACATNPLPVVVPCHRVLRSDGALGGYIGGLPAKTELLRLEAAA